MALWNARLDFALDSWAHVVRPLLVPTLYWWPLLLHRQAAIYARNYAAEEPQKPIPQKDWAMDIVDKQPFMFIHTCWHWVEPPGRSSAAPTLRSGWNCCHIECTAVSRDLININEHVAIQSDSVCGKKIAPLVSQQGWHLRLYCAVAKQWRGSITVTTSQNKPGGFVPAALWVWVRIGNHQRRETCE